MSEMNARHNDDEPMRAQIQRLVAARRLAEAGALCARLCQRRPRDPENWITLGRIQGELGAFPEAETSFRRALRLTAPRADIHYLLGKVQGLQGRLPQAAGSYGKALRLRPDFAEAHFGLGTVQQKLGHAEAAEKSYREALRLRPGYAQARFNLGTVLVKQDRWDEAERCYREVLQADPPLVEAHERLGHLYLARERAAEAEAAFRAALRVRPGDAETFFGLGNALYRQGKLGAAVEAYRRALERQPAHASACHNLAYALMTQGDVAEAMTWYRRALDLDPDLAGARGNYLLALNYLPGVSREAVYAEHCRWGARSGGHGGNGDARSRHRERRPDDPGRRLRIAYVSPDFRTHSVACFIEALLAHHDRREVEVFCYANLPCPDETTERLKALADHWAWIYGLDDEAAAARIRADGIDILVDLAGHTGHNRLALFARRPAPVQVSYLGYPNTTGLAAMDYRLTDAWADPPGETDAYYTERLVRLPRGFLCYTPPADAPPVGEIPSSRAGRVTFGSFNNLAKMTPEVVRLWARILRAVPDARLVLKNRALTDAATRERYAALFEAAGVARDRLDLRAWADSRAGHLAAYGGVDVALDTFPYNGTTTTCEALWMGVPVVTLAGDRHAGRVGLSLLHQVGLDAHVARDEDDYVAIAAALAGDAAARAALRAALRERMRASPLCDGGAFARDVEAAYRRMWQVRVKGEEQEPGA